MPKEKSCLAILFSNLSFMLCMAFLCAYLNPPGLRIMSKLLNCSVCLFIYIPSAHNIDLTVFIWESLLLSKCLS